MQAMNGSAGRAAADRLLYGTRAAALGFVFAPAANAAKNRRPTSLSPRATRSPSATRSRKFEANFPNEAPAYFEVNYPNELGKLLRGTKYAVTGGKGLTVVNNACPGETSDSLFGTGALGKAVDPTATQACPFTS